MNFRVIFCLIILVQAAFARIAKDVTGMNSSSQPQSAPASADTEAEPSAPPAPSPILPTAPPVEPAQGQAEDEPSHSHNQVSTGDEPFGSADLELQPEEVLNPSPATATGTAPPTSSGSEQLLEQDGDSSEESDEDKKR